jgi:putative ABC transport system permease protein
MSLSADFRHAFRSLSKAPAFSLAVLLTLGLAGGLGTAVFSLAYGILLRPLGVPRSERLVTLWQDMEARGGGRQETTGRSVFSAWRERNRTFAGMAAFLDMPADLTGIDPPENVPAAAVSHEYFSVLGVRPALGRGFLPDEETEGRHKVAVLSHALWARRFGSDRSIVGRPVSINDSDYTVVGVMPEGFRAPLQPQAEIWTILPFDPPADDWGYSYVNALGRLRDGVSVAAAQADMARAGASLATEHPDALQGVGVTLVPALDALTGPSRKLLLLLLGAVSLVLLVACVNVSSLVLSRATDRRAELAVRVALGARRGLLVRQVVLEMFLLALGGAALGALFGRLGLGLLRAFAPPQMPRLDDIRLDGPVLAVTAGVSLLAGLAAGLLAAFSLWRQPPADPLREATGATAGRATFRSRSLLVVAEVAASLMLLVGAGLLLRTLTALARVDPGFHTEKMVLGRLTLGPGRYPKPPDMAVFLAQLEERLQHRPEIARVGIVSNQPLADGKSEIALAMEGRRDAAEPPSALYRGVSPGYLGTMRLALVSGRPLTASDTAGAPPVALVNERFVRRYLDGRSPIGRRVRLDPKDDPEGPWWTIVGVVADVRGQSLDQEPVPEIYVPVAQRPSRRVTVVAVAAGPPAAALRALQSAATEIRPGQVISRPSTMDEVLDRALSPRRFAAGLLGGFAGVALALAAVGIYGIMALAVAQRRREIAVRLALGARTSAMTAMILRWSALLLAAGIALGLAGALLTSKALASLLYGVQPVDGWTLAGVVLLLALTAFLASLLPALRAGRVDPARTLRS